MEYLNGGINMRLAKRLISVVMAVAIIGACFAGCSSKTTEKYSKETAILGYFEEAEPFLYNVKDGKAEGFEADLWAAIFDSVKGDLKSYRFEQVEAGYTLEESGGFFDGTDREFSACLLFGAISKNTGTFNEDYSYTVPIITNRVITVVPKDSAIKTYADFAGAKVATVSSVSATAFEENAVIKNACASVVAVNTVDEALAGLGTIYDAVVVDEFTYCPTDAMKNDAYTIIDGELDTYEYVIACAKNSGWMWSINEAIREMKSEAYGDGDDFTPLVEKYFGYNASSFEYTTDGDK